MNVDENFNMAVVHLEGQLKQSAELVQETRKKLEDARKAYDLAVRWDQQYKRAIEAIKRDETAVVVLPSGMQPAQRSTLIDNADGKSRWPFPRVGLSPEESSEGTLPEAEGNETDDLLDLDD